MYFKNLLLTLFAAGLVSATNPEKTTTFEVLSLRSASQIHFAYFQAAKSKILLNLLDQKAACASESDNAATFKLTNGNLYLYHEPKTPQQLYVDRSKTGQGRLRYTTDGSTAPGRWERRGWKIDAYGNLSFNGDGFVACPNGIDGSWVIWVNVGVSQPGGGKGCLGLIARTSNVEEPNSCKYTQ
ncbi:hypothetical protein AK830_g8970 [Neonectria ditissima]|uniref:Cell wall protein PhiA n=1 Tax=Neonectria ditissima TaxID=78410 RepID=A0A0P7B6R4_9HYPO|nr:hypothetical protein AK830_g8970 [Neonectria ditissima]